MPATYIQQLPVIIASMPPYFNRPTRTGNPDPKWCFHASLPGLPTGPLTFRPTDHTPVRVDISASEK